MTVIARGCSDCNPQTEPRRHRLGDRHFSVDLPGVRMHNGKAFIDCMVDVLHDGVPTRDTSEVFVGPGGFARRFPTPIRRCGCGSGQPLVFIDEDDGYTVELPAN